MGVHKHLSWNDVWYKDLSTYANSYWIIKIIYYTKENGDESFKEIRMHADYGTDFIKDRKNNFFNKKKNR